MTDVPRDAFSFDLTLRHQAEDPSKISQALQIEPILSWAAGQKWAGGVHKTMCWQGTVSRGSGESDFEEALGSVASMLYKNREFLRELIASGGEIDVTVNFDLDEILPAPAGGGESKSKVFEMALYPDFITAVASVPAALRLHLWR